METNDINDFKRQLTQLTSDAKEMQKQSDTDAKAVLDLIRERDMLTKGVRRYFGISELTSASGVSSSGGLKWTKQSVANTTWTEQKQAQ